MHEVTMIPLSQLWIFEPGASRPARRRAQCDVRPMQKTLPAIAKPVTVTDATLAAEVEQSPIPVVVDVWAPWCGPCRMLAPTLDQLAAETVVKIKFAKLSSDKNRVTAARFNVTGLPTLLLFKNGQPIDRIVGLTPKSEIANGLRRAVGI